jgi:valyl-tRNA synthetase
MDKQYNHQIAEQDAHDKWHREKTYSLANNPGPLFSIDTPPPTVSGNLHIGHIFSYTQTDILARFARMDGKSVFYPFGFDDNGLPTERYVEKKLEISAHKLSRSEFIKLCLQETHEAEEQFKKLWQRMGLSADWDNCYSTISDTSRKISQESFLRLLEKKYVYRQDEPALYCTTCRTSVAQAELDDAEKPSVFYTIEFEVGCHPETGCKIGENGCEFGRGITQSPDHKPEKIFIATTRPELLGACNAIFYHPDDKRYQHLAQAWAQTPLFGHCVPILADEKVNPEKGTGLVMCCTFGDKTDVEWYKKYKPFFGLYSQVIGLDGRMKSNSLDIDLNGLTVTQGRAKMVEELEKRGLILDKKPIMHTVNVHERCKKEIEILMLPQWFLNLKDHKKKFIELADQINWYPAHMKSRYINWVENIGWDWCLSRQRFYGIPFPVWHCKNCQTIIPARIDQLPIDPQETPYTSACPECKSTDIVPDTDVMDTWNTSA